MENVQIAQKGKNYFTALKYINIIRNKITDSK